MDSQVLLQRVMFLVPMVLSLTVHEWAHAWSAMKLGDDTAEREGRLTLNPLVHIDPIGTLLLPLMGIPFGWAKPVPVNPARFRRSTTMGTGMAITAAAGPIANVVLAIASAVAAGLIGRFSPEFLAHQPGVYALLTYAIELNVALALFNLLPIPPLDGSRILELVLGYRNRGAFESFARISPILLVAVMLGGRFLFAGPASYVSGLLYDVVRSIAGL